MIPAETLQALKEAVEVARSYYMLFHDETWKARLTKWEAALQGESSVPPVQEDVLSGLRTAQYLNPDCAAKGCQWLVATADDPPPQCKSCGLEGGNHLPRCPKSTAPSVEPVQEPELTSDDLDALSRAIRVLDCGAHYCRYCPAGTKNGWQHVPSCPYEESQRSYAHARKVIDRLRKYPAAPSVPGGAALQQIRQALANAELTKYFLHKPGSDPEAWLDSVIAILRELASERRSTDAR